MLGGSSADRPDGPRTESPETRFRFPGSTVPPPFHCQVALMQFLAITLLKVRCAEITDFRGRPCVGRPSSSLRYRLLARRLMPR